MISTPSEPASGGLGKKGTQKGGTAIGRPALLSV